MNGQEKKIRDKLINQGEMNLTVNYEKGIRKMLENKLTKTSRVAYFVVSLVSILVTINLITVLGYNNPIPIIFAAIAILPTGALAFFSGWSAITGRIRGHFYPGFIYGGAVVIVGYYLMAMFYIKFLLPLSLGNALDGRSILGIQLMIMGFSGALVIGVLFILYILHHMKYQTHKKLLEIEYKIFEMANKDSENSKTDLQN